jgi:hypothetical protein
VNILLLTCEIPGEGFPDLEEIDVQEVTSFYSAEGTEDVCELFTVWIEEILILLLWWETSAAMSAFKKGLQMGGLLHQLFFGCQPLHEEVPGI